MKNNNINNFEFISMGCPPQQNDLIAFENDFINIINNFKVKKINNNFKRNLKKNLKMIN